MNQFQLILNQLDEALIQRSKSELLMISVLLVGLIGFGAYRFVIPINQKKITAFEKKLKNLENSNKDFKRAVKDNEEQRQMLKEVERNNDNIKDEIEKKKKSLRYIETKIKKQHSIKYSNEQWGVFFKTIQEKSIKHKITILEIKNRQIAPTPIIVPKEKPSVAKLAKDKNELKKDFRPIFTVELVSTSSFKDLLDFLIDLENNKLITNIEKLSIESNDDKTLKSNIKINLWGIK